MIELIDILLRKNPYIKNLSIADRIAVYNEALKQVAETREYFYTNQVSEINFYVNVYEPNLSSMDSIDDVLINDLEDINLIDRLLIYNMVQSRIASLRNLQNTHQYLITNSHGKIVIARKFLLPITNLVHDAIEYTYLQTKRLVLSIGKYISLAPYTGRTKSLVLPIATFINFALTAQKFAQKNIILPINQFISNVSAQAVKEKILTLPLAKMITSTISTTSLDITKRLVSPLAKFISTVTSVTTHTKTLSLSIAKFLSTVTDPTIHSKTLSLPIAKFVNKV